MAEHHFQREGYEVIPNILMLPALHLANQTERLKFGCGFNINPMWHPLRLAEDYAVADVPDRRPHYVRHRAGLPYARGGDIWRPDAGPADFNRELFEEQAEIIFKAFNKESFSHQGKHYTLHPRVPSRGYELTELSLVPRPLRRPVEC